MTVIHKVFTIYDCKAEMYLPPFYFKTAGQATRAFEESCNDPQHQFHKHPEDYTLFELGTYDDNSAVFEIGATPYALGKALEYIKGVTAPWNDKLTPDNGDARG